MRQLLTRFFHRLLNAYNKGDKVLLLLCVVATAFGGLMIASSTNGYDAGALRYIVIHILAAAAGIFFYVLISSADPEYFSEHRTWLVIINILLLSMLIPFGVTVNGNRSWISLPFLPFNIQVAEICKITYILIMASVMSARKNNLSHPYSIVHMLFHFILLFGMNVVISGDWGVSLIFFFIFVGMAFTGGVSMIWFGLAALLVLVSAPILWNFILADYQKTRIMVLFDPSLDPLGTDAMYHTIRAQRSLTGGGLMGQGLFDGNRTQAGALFAQHTDYIYAAIGEELGFVGCALVLVLMALIIGRCIWVGIRSQDLMRRLICFGAASAMIFQVLVNVGMCIGVAPVIGITLPFISYGGSSIITLYTMLGLVSGVYSHPNPTSHERYIRPPSEYIG